MAFDWTPLGQIDLPALIGILNDRMPKAARTIQALSFRRGRAVLVGGTVTVATTAVVAADRARRATPSSPTRAATP